MADSLFQKPDALQRQDLDSDALGVLEDLYRRLDAHWEHKPLTPEPDSPVPKWAAESVHYLLQIKAGTFGKDSKLPVDWLQAHASNPLTHHPFVTWEHTREFVLHAADAMLADPSYRIGSHFFPTTMDQWFLTKPPRKPRWSCFLRYANKVRTLDPVDLEHLPTHDAKVQRIRGKMSQEAKEAVEQALKGRGVDCFPATAWDRAGKLYAWWSGNKFQEVRNQFGLQEDRPEPLRHVSRVDRVAGTFGRLIGSVISWSQARGAWRGWFPVPGSDEWESFCDWCSAEHGACLRNMGPGIHVIGTRGRMEWEKYFDLGP